MEKANMKGKKANMKERVLNYMQKNHSITTDEAYSKLGCTRLSAYINLIKKTHVVHDEWVTSTNRYGEKVRYKRYWLAE